jgi:PAS domain S-box-containing protein
MDEQLFTTAGTSGEMEPGVLLKALPTAIYTTDAAGRITFYNEAAAELWGCHPELGKSEWCGSWRLYWPDGRPMPHDQCPMAMALKEKRAISGAEILAERPDGTRVPLLANPTPICGELGVLLGGVNSLVDITGRKEAERSARQLAAIVESSDDAILSQDLNGIVNTWNRAAERLYGWTADQIIGLPVEILIPPDRRDEETFILKRARGGHRIQFYETHRRRKDGSLVDVSLTVSPIKNAQGRVVSVSKIARDITERKQAEHLAQRLAAIVESSDDAIVSKDLNGIITTWNPGSERLFGYTAKEAIGKPVTILIPADRQDEEPGILERIRRGERTDHYETIRRRKDGSLIDISLTVSPIKDVGGRVIGASKIARDITERRRAREQQHLLFREMNHRVKNLFAVSGSILALSARYARTPSELAGAVQERFLALARAHDLTLPDVTSSEMKPERATTLATLIQTILAPWANRGHAAINGPEVPVSGKAAEALALLLHEMATNASKYGALSAETGYVEVSWCMSENELNLTWRERGGPPLSGKPEKEGFGSLLARLTITDRLGGKISHEWDREGLTVKLSAPLERLMN